MQDKDGKDGEKMRSAAMHCTTRQASVQGTPGEILPSRDYEDPEYLLGEFAWLYCSYTVNCHSLDVGGFPCRVYRPNKR